MARCTSGPALGTQFDDFLFASVRDDGRGPLSVLSALARLDVDPWETAATLAGLPRAAAVQRLASLFAGLPESPEDRDAIAGRLITFLPDQSKSQVKALTAFTPTRREANVQTAGFVVIYIISMLVVLSVQGLAQSRQPSPSGSVVQSPAVGRAPTPTHQASAGR